MTNFTIKAAICVALVAFLSLPAISQEAATAALPKVDELIEKHIEASGGRDALAKVKTTVAEGKFEIPAAGVTAEFVVQQAAPNKFLFTMEIANVGEINRGTDGKTAWEKSPATGVRLMEGVEKTQMIRQSQLSGELRLAQDYDITMEGIEKVDDDDCFKLTLVPKNVDAAAKETLTETRFVDQKTFLLRRMDITAITPGGNTAVEVHMKDYRKIDGVMIPHEVVQKISGFEQSMKMTKVEVNKEIDAETFKVPEE